MKSEMIEDEDAGAKRRRVNIGAGQTYIPHFSNVDIVDWAEISLDLNSEPLPFPDNSVEIVFAYHTLEHLRNYLFALSEIHRVLQHGGQLLVGVPYVTSTLYNLVNPYHHQHFNEFAFDFFDPSKLLGSASEPGTVMFRKVFHRFHYMPEFDGKPEEEKEFCRRHWFNVVKKMDFGLVAMKMGQREPIINGDMAARLTDRFDKLLASRKRYPGRTAF